MKNTTKQKNKLIAILISVALLFSSVNFGMVMAEGGAVSTGVTVTLRMETDSDTLIAPVSVTMTEEDMNNDFGVGLATGVDATYSPLRAFAKYLAKEKNVSNADMNKYIMASSSDYGLWIQGLSVSGDGVGAAGVDSDVSWMYSVNGQGGDVSMDQYDCKTNDSVVIYGSYFDNTNFTSSEYTEFDKTEYHVQAGEEFTVTLNAFGVIYENWSAHTYSKPVDAAKIYVVSKLDGVQGATSENATMIEQTDKDGKAVLSIAKKGTYVLSAGKLAEDGKHNLIGRPYATVTVSKQTNAAPSTQPSVKPSTQPKDQDTVKKPAKVKKLLAKAAKSQGKKKKVTLTWQKASAAKGYEIYISNKKNKNYKKQKTVKNKTKATLKLKKGTYFIKVRAYNQSGKVKKSGAYSNIVKLKVK